MFIRKPEKFRYSEVTPEATYLNRRSLLAGMGAAAAFPSAAFAKGPLNPTPYDSITTYNNFYEFGTGKEDPARNAHTLTTDPWSIKIDGEVGKPGTYALEDIVKPHAQEERVYRFRCVEAWSMVIPWVGFSLADLQKSVEPTSKAKYVAFETLVRPDEMPGQRGLFQPLPWPYVEGLRMDEAMHPLTLMATGIYGKDLLNQNGAPIRLVVPWKYGFKSIKSIVRITLTENEPPTTWNNANAGEYGFYSNVNPEVDHRRWSQASERPIGAGAFAGRIPTLMFNGYAEDVAELYAGMDLKKNF